MSERFVRQSLETHLFFARIMKEHALFLKAGFPAVNTSYIEKAEWFRQQFEEFLAKVVEESNELVSEEALQSGEIVTEYTLQAEKMTSCLTGIDIDSQITEAEKRLCSGARIRVTRELMQKVRRLNERAIWLTNGLIEFKDMILKNVAACQLYTTNYPLLVEHIRREAKLYCSTVMELNRRGYVSSQNLRTMEIFWNQIMMEHAQFIRGLLDPTEVDLMETANEFAESYAALLEEAKKKDEATWDELTRRTLVETERYRDFKAAGAEGLNNCKITSIILPLLADHVLREANHYLRILGDGMKA
ncbi:MAG: DUF2935 domain-containing protein [Lachnospiraceae bacterium]|nr:DUF2935 domain-containing protein [Lachnospiraceae bacterium]